jgi:hypothetical protein
MFALAGKNFKDSTLQGPVSQGNSLATYQDVRCVSNWQEKDSQFIWELSRHLRLSKNLADRRHADFRSEELGPVHAGTETIYHRTLSSLVADDFPGRIGKRPHAYDAAVSGFHTLLRTAGNGPLERSETLRHCIAPTANDYSGACNACAVRG